MAGLRTAIYKVNDLSAAKEWYSKAFGTAPYFDEPFYVGFDIGGYELGLQPDDYPADKKGESVAAYWDVDDVASEYDRFIALGAQPNEAPQEVGGNIIVATLRDPWNNVIGLIRNPHFKVSQV